MIMKLYKTKDGVLHLQDLNFVLHIACPPNIAEPLKGKWLKKRESIYLHVAKDEGIYHIAGEADHFELPNGSWIGPDLQGPDRGFLQ